MIDNNNNNIETFSTNNPFIFDKITDSNIGTSFDKESASTGDIVCVTSLYSELIRRFGSYENAKLIYEFAKDAIVHGNYRDYTITSEPYLDFTIYLEQTIIDEGVLSPHASKWIAGKKYYIGDTVYYSMDGSDENIKTYVLVRGDYFETVEVPFSIYQANSGYTNYFENNGKYYAQFGYYSGYYDEKTKLAYFDKLNSGGTIDLIHWEENTVTNVSSVIVYSGITGMTESLLQNVMRRKTDMDISGNTLPFILHYNDIIEKGNKIGRELDTGSTETFYMCGNVNMDYDFTSQKVISDVLESVTFYNSSSIPESGVSFTNVNVPIILTANKEAYTDENDKKSIADYNMVQFVYYLSATLVNEDNNWIRKQNTGVKYIEQRPMAVQTNNFVIEADDGSGVMLNLTYIDVNSNTQSETDYNNIDIINSLRTNINYSNITVNRDQLADDYFLNSAIFKDESTMGIQNVMTDINVNIERGIAESFQKHNMLGEICTLQDLENYKNGRYLE